MPRTETTVRAALPSSSAMYPSGGCDGNRGPGHQPIPEPYAGLGCRVAPPARRHWRRADRSGRPTDGGRANPWLPGLGICAPDRDRQPRLRQPGRATTGVPRDDQSGRPGGGGWDATGLAVEAARPAARGANHRARARRGKLPAGGREPPGSVLARSDAARSGGCRSRAPGTPPGTDDRGNLLATIRPAHAGGRCSDHQEGPRRGARLPVRWAGPAAPGPLAPNSPGGARRARLYRGRVRLRHTRRPGQTGARLGSAIGPRVVLPPHARTGTPMEKVLPPRPAVVREARHGRSARARTKRAGRVTGGERDGRLSRRAGRGPAGPGDGAGRLEGRPRPAMPTGRGPARPAGSPRTATARASTDPARGVHPRALAGALRSERKAPSSSGRPPPA